MGKVLFFFHIINCGLLPLCCGSMPSTQSQKRGGSYRTKASSLCMGKVLLVLFCLFPFFSALITPPHHHTPTHTHHSPHNMTHWCTQSHANRTVCCAALFWESGQQDTLHHPHPSLHHLTSHNTHKPTQHRHSSWYKQQRDDNNQ